MGTISEASDEESARFAVACTRLPLAIAHGEVGFLKRCGLSQTDEDTVRRPERMFPDVGNMARKRAGRQAERSRELEDSPRPIIFW